MIYPDPVLTKSTTRDALYPVRTVEIYGLSTIAPKSAIKKNWSEVGGKA
jgi:hypothetical protein